jgi:hypothetical protein
VVRILIGGHQANPFKNVSVALTALRKLQGTMAQFVFRLRALTSALAAQLWPRRLRFVPKLPAILGPRRLFRLRDESGDGALYVHVQFWPVKSDEWATLAA